MAARAALAPSSRCCSRPAAVFAPAAVDGVRSTTAAAWRAGAAAAAASRQRPRPRHPLVRCAAASSADGDSGASSSQVDVERLNRMLAGPQLITGPELRDLVFEKWGRSFDVRLQRRGKRMYLHVMWRFLEQQSFPLTEDEYDLQLEAVASYLNMWQAQDTVRAGIRAANKRGPGFTGGGNARAVSIPLGVDVGGVGRANEWNSF